MLAGRNDQRHALQGPTAASARRRICDATAPTSSSPAPGSAIPISKSAVPITTIGGAELEELGDLKLYRIPDPVTVAANAQKQVALLSRSKVPVERITAAWLQAGRRIEPPEEAGILLRTRNVKARNLGLPLPMGPLAIFEDVGGRQMLTGQGAIADSAVGQEVEIGVGASPGVHVRQRFAPKKKARGRRPAKRMRRRTTAATSPGATSSR